MVQGMGFPLHAKYLETHFIKESNQTLHSGPAVEERVPLVVAHRQLWPVDARVVWVIVAAGGVGHGGEGGGHSVDLCQHIVAVVDLTRNALRRMIFIKQCNAARGYT